MLLLIYLVILNLSADFIQEKECSYMNDVQVSTGHFEYRAPNYLKWEYISPYSIVWKFDGKNGNMSPKVQKLVTLIMQFISCNEQFSNDDFNIQHRGNIYSLMPKKREYCQMFDEIVISVNPKTGIADEVKIVEKNKDVTLLRFSNVTQ